MKSSSTLVNVFVIAFSFLLLMSCQESLPFTTRVIDNDLTTTEIKQLRSDLLSIEKQYKNRYKVFNNLEHYIDYMDQMATDQEIEKLKAFFVHDLIYNTDQWHNHAPHIAPTTLRDILKKFEQTHPNSPYKAIIIDAVASLYVDTATTPFIGFSAKNIDGTTINLSDFSSKVLILDYWATWCSPCLEQEPYWETLVEKYANEKDIIFIKISIDKDQIAWKNHVESNLVFDNQIDLIVDNPTQFQSEQGVSSLPRYSIISCDGNYYTPYAPKPKSSTFDYLIQQMISSCRKQVK